MYLNMVPIKMIGKIAQWKLFSPAYESFGHSAVGRVETQLMEEILSGA
jgi:hypothetical protein